MEKFTILSQGFSKVEKHTQFLNAQIFSQNQYFENLFKQKDRKCKALAFRPLNCSKRSNFTIVLGQKKTITTLPQFTLQFNQSRSE